MPKRVEKSGSPSSCLETTTTSSQSARSAVVAGLYVLASEDALACFTLLVATLPQIDRVEIALQSDYGRLWSEEGLLTAICPPIVQPWAWRRLRKKVREAWNKFGRQARSMKDCGLLWKHFECRSCRRKAPRQHLPIVCMSRYCPDCAQAKRRRSQARSLELVSRWNGPLRFLTLTIRTHPFAKLVRQRRDLAAAFTKLKRRRWWKDHVDGGLCASEATRGSSGSAWHAHLHLLLDGKFMLWARLVDEWQSCTGCTCASRPQGPHRGPAFLVRGPAGARRVSDLKKASQEEAWVALVEPGPIWCCRTEWDRDKEQRVTFCTDPDCECEGAQGGPTGVNIKAYESADAVREVSKYVCKELGGKQANLEPEVMAEFLRASYGRRQFTTFGIHFDPELEAELDRICANELEDPDEEESCGVFKPCPRCKGEEFFFIAIEPADRGPP